MKSHVIAARIYRWLPLIVLLLIIADEAWARVGGGQGFSSGRRSSGGSGRSGGSSGFSGGHSGGGGGSDGLGDAIGLFIWFVFTYPHLGIPLILFVVIATIVLKGKSLRLSPSQGRSYDSVRVAPSVPRANRLDWSKIQVGDPQFSFPALQDFLQEVHRRAMEAAVRGNWGSLEPFFDPKVRTRLENQLQGRKISEVVLGSMVFESVLANSQEQRFTVRLPVCRLELLPTGTERLYIEERWTFVRPSSVHSPAPERLRRLGCPNCGASIETDSLGNCQACGTSIANGQLTWRVIEVENLEGPRLLTGPDLSTTEGGVEPAFHLPTVSDPELGQHWRQFMGRHPQFEYSKFEDTVRTTFFELQNAWSANQLEQIRPHVTDPLFQTLRFYIEQYRQEKLRNALNQIQIHKIELNKVNLDAWYEAITVRLHASMTDAIVDSTGKVIGGNATAPRYFSEYWTFLRAAGKGDVNPKDRHNCPSCGSKLDRINAAGICEYCDSKITTGDFDWVLSRIEQAEVYAG